MQSSPNQLPSRPIQSSSSQQQQSIASTATTENNDRGRIINNNNLDNNNSSNNLTTRDSSTEGYTQPNGNKQASGKVKTGTSHVICKFWKQSSCSSGSSCAFSHEAAQPGTSKPICDFFVLGNCRFGAKCQLAHILPGQPYSLDRKNKRAAQAALREQQNQQLALETSPRLQNATINGTYVVAPVSGIGRSLKNTSNSNEMLNSRNVGIPSSSPRLLNGSPRLSNATPPTIKSNAFPLHALSPPTIVEALTTSSSPSFEATLSRPPIIQNLPPPSYAHPNPSLNPSIMNPPPSGLSQTLNPQFAAKGSSSVAGHVLLGQHGRRLSNNNSNSAIRALSPPRMTPRKTTGYSAAELLEASPIGSGSSPLALPAVLPNSSGHIGIFGTSPFSGSRSLFMPSSYDSSLDGDNGFSRSPTNGGSRGLEEMRRSNSNNLPWDRPVMLGFNVEDNSAIEDGENGVESDDEYEEGFLPSSLNDLLTPEEQRRRSSRLAGFNPFQNHSVPADLMLSTQPSMFIPNNASSLLSPTQPISRSLLSNSSFPINSPPFYSNDFLSVSPSHQSSQLQPVRPLFSQSYDPSSTSRFLPSTSPFNSIPPTDNSLLSNYFSPSLTNGNNNTTITTTTATGSLPGELAAGLSHLHLASVNYTGETPVNSFLGIPNQNGVAHPLLGSSPNSLSQQLGIGSNNKSNGGGAWGSTSPSSWGSSSNGLLNPNASVHNKKGIQNSSGLNSTSSPLHLVETNHSNFEENGVDDDEIQFDMDT